jgi:hypothetical protein
MSWNVEGDLDFTTAFPSNGILSNFTNSRSDEYITFIPMETTEFDGVKSLLSNVY